MSFSYFGSGVNCGIVSFFKNKVLWKLYNNWALKKLKKLVSVVGFYKY